MLIILAIVCNKLQAGNLVLTVEPNGIHQIGTYGPLQRRHRDVIHCLPARDEIVLGKSKGMTKFLVFLIEALNRGILNFCNW